VSYDPESEVRDSVYVGELVYRSWVSRNNRGGHSYRTIPYTPRPLTVVDPDGGLWSTGADAYRIIRFDDAGDTVLVLTSDTPSPPVTDDDHDRYVDQLVERDPTLRPIAREVVNHMPETKPPVVRLLVDDERRLWVMRATSDTAGAHLDAFDHEGHYLGSVYLRFTPASYLPIRIRHGRLYAVVLDEFDVPFVVRSETIVLGRGVGND
jgi:streptogramin lyase